VVEARVNPAIRIAIVGAESTGKTALAQALSRRLGEVSGLACTWVPELLRQWCDANGRTPQQHEQIDIARGQQRRINAAAAAHDVVVCDTTALMTAVYSRMVFGDRSLDAYALAEHARCQATLLTALDLPWVADGMQRDGAHVREPVDAFLRELLAGHGLGWSLVAGQGDKRVEAAVDAVAPLLRPLAGPRSGLFSRLLDRDAAAPGWPGPWRCESCDAPECEHADRVRRREAVR
jgi:nicotinamide riboside kinase